jgi:hypothetical protein
MNETQPSALLVRITHTHMGEPACSLTMDNSADRAGQRDLVQSVRNIGEHMSRVYGARLNPDDEIEILTGRTANRIERQEDLLRECRDVLLHIPGLYLPDLEKRMADLLADIDTELGHDD